MSAITLNLKTHTAPWLGPCPFCGKLYAVRLLENEGTFFVNCEHCGGNGPMMTDASAASALWKMALSDRLKGAGVDIENIAATKEFCQKLGMLFDDADLNDINAVLPADSYGLPADVDAVLAEFSGTEGHA